MPVSSTALQAFVRAVGNQHISRTLQVALTLKFLIVPSICTHLLRALWAISLIFQERCRENQLFSLKNNLLMARLAARKHRFVLTELLT